MVQMLSEINYYCDACAHTVSTDSSLPADPIDEEVMSRKSGLFYT